MGVDRLPLPSERMQLEWKRRLENTERQRDAMQRQRDEAVQLYKDAKREAEESNRMRLLAEQSFGTAGRKAERELQRQIASVCQARDSATAQIADLKQRIADLDDIVADVTYCKEVAESNAQQAELALRELRSQSGAASDTADEISTLRSEVASLTELNSSLSQQLEAQNETVAALEAELADTRASSTASEEADGDKLAQFEEKLAEAESRAIECDVSKQRFDEIRTQFLEVNVKLEAAHTEILNLTASLAEARLKAKLASKLAKG